MEEKDFVDKMKVGNVAPRADAAKKGLPGHPHQMGLGQQLLRGDCHAARRVTQK